MTLKPTSKRNVIIGAIIAIGSFCINPVINYLTGNDNRNFEKWQFEQNNICAKQIADTIAILTAKYDKRMLLTSDINKELEQLTIEFPEITHVTVFKLEHDGGLQRLTVLYSQLNAQITVVQDWQNNVIPVGYASMITYANTKGFVYYKDARAISTVYINDTARLMDAYGTKSIFIQKLSYINAQTHYLSISFDTVTNYNQNVLIRFTNVANRLSAYLQQYK